MVGKRWKKEKLGFFIQGLSVILYAVPTETIFSLLFSPEVLDYLNFKVNTRPYAHEWLVSDKNQGSDLIGSTCQKFYSAKCHKKLAGTCGFCGTVVKGEKIWKKIQKQEVIVKNCILLENTICTGRVIWILIFFSCDI